MLSHGPGVLGTAVGGGELLSPELSRSSAGQRAATRSLIRFLFAARPLGWTQAAQLSVLLKHGSCLLGPIRPHCSLSS